jgi:SAM-dependent methyltransferase
MASAITPAHLGGHHGITHTDSAILAYLQQRYSIRTMLDVGCGPGGMLDCAARLGIDAFGVDGDPDVARPDVFIHDYTTDPFEMLAAYDLVWCVEFVEHVEAQYIANFLATFRSGRVLFLTHAVPGQTGHHHVNEQPPAYWRAILQADGWTEDTEATEWVRQNGTDVYTKATGMVWVR